MTFPNFFAVCFEHNSAIMFFPAMASGTRGVHFDTTVKPSNSNRVTRS